MEGGVATPIHQAAEKGDMAKLTRLLEVEDGGVLVNSLGMGELQRRGRPLHFASKGGHVEAVRFLLDRGAVANLRDEQGSTALLWACLAGRKEVVVLLLRRGSDPTIKGVMGVNALINAARGGTAVDDDVVVVEEEERDEDDEDDEGDEGREEGEGAAPTAPAPATAAPTAPATDHLGVLKLLLKRRRVGVNELDEYGRTALWYACMSDHKDRALRLLLCGADKTVKDQQGRSPMCIAEHLQNRSCVKVLKEFDPDSIKRSRLRKARIMVDDLWTLTHAPDAAAAAAPGGNGGGIDDWQEAHRLRLLAAPAYLKGRLEKGIRLPSVEVGVGDGQGAAGRRRREEEGERARMLTGVAKGVLEMKGEPFNTLLDMLTPSTTTSTITPQQRRPRR